MIYLVQQDYFFSVSNESSVFPEEANEDHFASRSLFELKRRQETNGTEDSDFVSC